MDAPRTYKKAIDNSLDDLTFVCVHRDDIAMFSRNMNEKLKQFGEVLGGNSHFSLNQKISKFDLCQEYIIILSHVLDRDGVKVDEHEIGKL